MAYKKLTNTTSNERRAIFTQEGYVTIEPGQSRVVDVEDADLKANKDYFKAESASEEDANAEEAILETDRINPANDFPEAKPNDAYDGMTDDALRDLIEDRDGKRPHHNTSRGKLLEAARKEG